MVIGIAGGGKMGNDLFNFFTGRGYPVRFYVRNANHVAEIRHKYLKKLRRMSDNGIVSGVELAALTSLSEISSDIETLRGADLIIETVSESWQAKKDFYSTLHLSGFRPALMASNSSSFHPGVIMDLVPDAYPILGLHFFYPVALHPFAELILPENQGMDNFDKVFNLAHNCGLDLLQLPRTQPFLINRVFLEMQAEAFRWAIDFSVALAEIDTWCTAHLFPLGLFNMVENVGRDVMAQSITNYLPLSINKAAVGMFYQYVSGNKRLALSEGPLSDRYDFFNCLHVALRQVYFDAVRQFCTSNDLDEVRVHLIMADFVGLSGNCIFEP